MTHAPESEEDVAARMAIAAFEREVGVTNITVKREHIGSQQFLQFTVGRDAPVYTDALYRTQQALSADNPFRGAIDIFVERSETFPNSTEASALLTLLTRSTREVSQDEVSPGYRVPYIPFQKREDHQLAQPASHIVRGRRGVGKSTLIRRAIDLLQATPALVAVLDMQSYSTIQTAEDLHREVLYDICKQISDVATEAGARHSKKLNTATLLATGAQVLDGSLNTQRAPAAIKRSVKELAGAIGGHAFVFLDDFHLIDLQLQPGLLHSIHAALKGANGWIKVAGLSSLLNTYSQTTRQGLQVPGDAQFISLDLTLENPEAAETHLRAILESFLGAVGHRLSKAVMPESAFKRLVWATAGVPRDFLQMFGRSIEHAQRNRHTTITLSDVNIAIGEFGQQKMDDVLRDARNEADVLKRFLARLETFCLDEKKVNAFLVRSEDSRERALVHALSDLRMLHLIHQSITPHRAGQRYEAYIIDYSIFTGFRRRPGVREMVPHEAQFKAAELRVLPRIEAGFLADSDSESST